MDPFEVALMRHFEIHKELTTQEEPTYDSYSGSTMKPIGTNLKPNPNFYSSFTNNPFDLVLEYVGDNSDATLDAFHIYIEEVYLLQARRNQWPP